MKMILRAAMCGTAALALATTAQAGVTIAGSVTSITVLTNDPGLVLYASPTAFASFTLDNVGDTHSTNVMTIGTQETSVGLDDLATAPVSATFAFTSPTGAGGTANGSSSGFFRLLSACGVVAGGCGQVSWTNPTVFNFGDGGAFSVSLSNVEFATPGSANVSATFRLISNAVPEPSTWAMLILGFGMVGGALRSRRQTRQTLSYS